MKKCGSTSSSSKVMDQLVDIINSFSVVHKDAMDGCQHFSMRQYVADTREKDPKACNPFGEKNYQIWEQLKAPLDVPRFKWWRCTNCVRDLVASSTSDLPELQESSHRQNAQLSTLQLCASVEHKASGDAEGEGSKAPIEVIILDDSDNEGEIQEFSRLKELASMAELLIEKESAEEGIITEVKEKDAEGEGSKAPIEVIILDDSDNEGEIQEFGRLKELASVAELLIEKESAGEGQEFISLRETENAKRPSPFSQNTDLIPRKRSKATGESSRPRQEKQKGTFKRSGTGGCKSLGSKRVRKAGSSAHK